MFGIDLSPGMITAASELCPDITFQQGDMYGLACAGGSLVAIVAWYSLIHIPRDDVGAVLIELRRVLREDGLLFLAFHIGEESVSVHEWWGKQVDVEFMFFGVEEMEQSLRSAGFEIEQTVTRDPYDGVEHPTRRAYILARKTCVPSLINGKGAAETPGRPLMKPSVS